MRILYLFLLIPFLAFAQEPWEKTNGPYGGTINGFASKPNSDLYAVNSTAIYKSTNNGASWFLLTDEVSNINTIEVAPSGRIYLGTSHRGVWWSDNDGITWDNNQITNNTHTGLGATVLNIHLNSSGHIFTSSWRSLNGGISWTQLSIYASDFLFISGTEIIAAAFTGVHKSVNNGSSWTPLSNGIGNIQTSCIELTSSGVLIVGTPGNGIYLSNNNGANWSQSNTGLTDLNVQKLGVDANNNIFASTEHGIFISQDNGSTWQHLNIGVTTSYFNDFDIVNNELFSSTRRFGILRSTDSGTSWSPSNEGINILSPKKVVSNSTGIFLLSNGTLYFSSDSGMNWEPNNTELSVFGATSAETDNDGNLYAGTINEGLFKSTDNGNTWINFTLPNNNRADDVKIDNAGNIFINSSGKLYLSSDGGTNWFEIFNPDTAFFVPQFFAVNDNGSIFYGGFTFFLDEVIFYSNDLGVTWDSVDFGSFNELTSMYSDGENVYAAFDDLIRYTADNGLTWQIFSNFTGSTVSAMTKLSNGIFVIAAFDGVFYTTDNGTSWNNLSAGLSPSFGAANFIGSDLNSMLYAGYYSEGVFRNDNWFNPVPVELVSFTASVSGSSVQLKWITASEINNAGFEIERSQKSNVKSQIWERIGFVEGKGTTVNQSFYSFTDSDIREGKYSYRLKQLDLDGTFTYSNVIEADFSLPEKFALNQNYPNPFNPSTTIEFQVPEGGIVSLSVFDILGNMISTLINEKKEPGFYKVEFDASEYASGTYFYQLKAGNKIETKKLILLR